MESIVKQKRTFLDMNGYQWTVIFAAWLGWGFDVFDGLLFNYVAPNCVPTLLGLTHRFARSKGGDAAMDGNFNFGFIDRLGNRRRDFRQSRGQDRAHENFAFDDAALRNRHGGCARLRRISGFWRFAV